MTIKDQMFKWANQHECVKLWASRYPNVKVRYRNIHNLFRFLEWAKVTPEELLALKDNPQSVDAERLVDLFSTVEDGFTYATKRNVINSVKSFFRCNYKDLKRNVASLTYEKEDYTELTKDKMWKLFLACHNPRDRALFLFVTSTAAAAESVDKATWGMFEDGWEYKDVPNIIFPSSIIKGHGKGKYRGVKQVTFLTPDAKKYMIEYRMWIERKLGRQFTKDDRIFWTIGTHKTGYLKPIGYSGLAQTMKRISETANVKFTLHYGRRWVETALEDAGIPNNWMKKIKGRKPPGEENPYSRPQIEQLRDKYRQAVSKLQFIPKSKEQQVASAIGQARALLATVPKDYQDESMKAFLANLPAKVRETVKKSIRLTSKVEER